MGFPASCLGDAGEHGGFIISASDEHLVGGKPVARLGDIYLCPEHGPNPIICVQTQSQSGGRPVAHLGAQALCGARILIGSSTVEIG
jgi:uncharacterized Zn-binding protein involved in type VI secretion